MKRTKSPNKKRSLPKSKRKSKHGAKSKCTDEVIEQAYRLCLLGLTNKELAVAFNVDKTTISYWYKNKPKFKQALDKGRTFADAEVAEALKKRATGFSHPATKIMKKKVKEYDEDGNVIRQYDEPMRVPYMKHYPPNVKAAIKWLGVRNREEWGESYKVEHKHAHMHVGGMNIHTIMEEVSDTEKFSDEELKALAKLGLNEKQQEITGEVEVQ